MDREGPPQGRFRAWFVRDHARARTMEDGYEIRVDDLGGPEIAVLLQEHLDSMATISPPESCHALDVDELRKPDATVWCVWHGSELAGCGALKELSDTHAEVKSMKTAEAHLRRGVAAKLLEHMLDAARVRGYRRLSLETGSQVEFIPARTLYKRYGFEECGPFADYHEDPNSVFMTKALTTSLRGARS